MHFSLYRVRLLFLRKFRRSNLRSSLLPSRLINLLLARVVDHPFNRLIALAGSRPRALLDDLQLLLRQDRPFIHHRNRHRNPG